MVEQHWNWDLESIVTPLNIIKYEQLLRESNFDGQETAFLLHGFRCGFNIGYNGPKKRRNLSKNIPFTVGNWEILWGKIMKEVKVGRFAGPFSKPPFEFVVQSPISLVPKVGNKTRLIFHLSFDFSENEKSVNACTPGNFAQLCTRIWTMKSNIR